MKIFCLIPLAVGLIVAAAATPFEINNEYEPEQTFTPYKPRRTLYTTAGPRTAYDISHDWHRNTVRPYSYPPRTETHTTNDWHRNQSEYIPRQAVTVRPPHTTKRSYTTRRSYTKRSYTTVGPRTAYDNSHDWHNNTVRPYSYPPRTETHAPNDWRRNQAYTTKRSYTTVGPRTAYDNSHDWHINTVRPHSYPPRTETHTPNDWRRNQAYTTKRSYTTTRIPYPKRSYPTAGPRTTYDNSHDWHRNTVRPHSYPPRTETHTPNDWRRNQAEYIPRQAVTVRPQYTPKKPYTTSRPYTTRRFQETWRSKRKTEPLKPVILYQGEYKPLK